MEAMRRKVSNNATVVLRHQPSPRQEDDELVPRKHQPLRLLGFWSADYVLDGAIVVTVLLRPGPWHCHFMLLSVLVALSATHPFGRGHGCAFATDGQTARLCGSYES